MFGWPFLFSVAPFAVFLYLLLFRKKNLLFVSEVTLLIVAVLAVFYWRIIPNLLLISYTKGFFIAFDIFIIIAGAIFFLEVSKKLKIIDNVSYHLESFSKDYRVKVIILAWFLENFLEGTAGFGTPSTVVAPLLIGLGLNPMAAVIVALLGNSASVVFGAAGAPIRIGFSGIESATRVPEIAALINFAGLFVPVFMLFFITAGKKDRKDQILEALPFAIFSGLAFVVPSFLSVSLGQEFPSIIGAAIGTIIIFGAVKLNIFMPKRIRKSGSQSIKPQKTLSPFETFFPYIILIVLLVFGKFFLGTKSVLISYFGINHDFSFFNPGFAFIITGLLLIFWKIKNKPGKIASLAIKDSFIRTIEPFLVIALMSAMVQIMINSGNNFSEIPSSIAILAKNFENSFLPIIAPFVGAFGSFMTGSATVSNIMFGKFLETAASVIGYDAAIILSLGLVGGAAGNMIALADIMTAEAVVGIKNKEREVIKGVFIPCFIYLILISLIGIIII
ncbi:MAG: L-lactate permease [Candidatus Pacebacteria bacterium]|nr:L-lactate permease [Candidatus Paceibacterota bacterium]